MKRCLLAILLIQCSFVYAQKRQTDPDCKSFSDLDKNEKNAFLIKDCHRTRNFIFARQTLLYSSLSQLSGPFMDLGSAKKYYIISADVSPQFVIGGRWMPFPIHITPRYQVRILHNDKSAGDSSLPVRTPSYMPGITVYFPLNKCDSANSQNLKYFSASFFHHSNGQDGNEFNSATRELNHYNGNFSTNFFETAFFYRKRSTIKNVDFCGKGGAVYHEWFTRAGYEFHMWTADSLKSSYGLHRINLQYGHLWVKSYRDLIMGVPIGEAYQRETWRIIADATFIAGRRDIGLGGIEHRINFNLSAYRRIPSSGNTAGFVNVGYYGSDPYNIYYDQNYFYIKVGIAAGFFYTPRIISESR